MLRRFQSQDSTALLSIFADKRVMQYSDGLKELDWIQQWIQKPQESYDQQGYGNWAVTLVHQSECFGYCGLTDQDDVCGVAETTLKRLVAAIDLGNLASIQVA